MGLPLSNLPQLVDYHVHPGYSIDAAPVSIDEYCAKGITLNLAEICFTPHLEVDESRRHIDWFVRCENRVMRMDNPRWLELYFQDIDHARKKYSPDLIIKAGIEVGFEPGRESYIEKILTSYPFDFVLGSIHCLDHIAISSKKECGAYFANKTSANMADSYFNMLDLAVKSRLFDCMAHIDLYRRYGKAFLGSQTEDLHKGYIENIFLFMAKHSIGLEINTSGLRRGLDDLHPSPMILQTAIDSGVNFYTIGSDAHSLNEIGQGLSQAEHLIKKHSLSITTYTCRKPD